MPLSSKQKKQFMQWLKEHNVSSTCPACGSTEGWGVHDSIITGLDVDLKKKKAAPSQAGFFMMVCKNCMHVMFFAAAPIVGRNP